MGLPDFKMSQSGWNYDELQDRYSSERRFINRLQDELTKRYLKLFNDNNSTSCQDEDLSKAMFVQQYLENTVDLTPSLMPLKDMESD